MNTAPDTPPAKFEHSLQMTLDDVSTFLDTAFPTAARPALGQLVSVELDHVRMALQPDADMVRPGGIVSGPILMGLADVAAYAVILAHIGPVAMAVTNTLNITFLRACRVETITVDARLLKLGRRIATIDIRIWQQSEADLVAQATVGYVLPPVQPASEDFI